MANNYTSLSFSFELVSKEAGDWLEARYKELLADEENWDGAPTGICFSIRQESDDSWAAHVWDDGGNANVEGVVKLVQEYMIEFKVEKPIYLMAAYTCDRPRTDEFGGCGCVVTRDEQYWVDTGIWVRDKIEELAGKK
jgi:hypothetical protein